MYNDRHNDTMTAKARQMNLSIYTCIYGDFSFVAFNRNWAIKGYRGIGPTRPHEPLINYLINEVFNLLITLN
jgi:hypothetical protein